MELLTTLTRARIAHRFPVVQYGVVSTSAQSYSPLKHSARTDRLGESERISTIEWRESDGGEDQRRETTHDLVGLGGLLKNLAERGGGVSRRTKVGAANQVHGGLTFFEWNFQNFSVESLPQDLRRALGQHCSLASDANAEPDSHQENLLSSCIATSSVSYL